MSPSPVRIAVIGLDHWYAALPFAQKAATQPGFQLTAIVEPDTDRAAHAAALTGGTRTTDDLEAVLADPTVDAIACFTSVEKNPGICIAAAAAGKHIVSVKPLAMTLPDADRIVDAVEAAGVVFIPSESRRTSPLATRLSSWVHSGRLGQLRSGTFTMDAPVPSAWPGATTPGWWADPTRAPGGAWIDHAVYHLDRMHWLFDSDVTDITGHTANIARKDLPVEDYGHAILTLAGGAVVTIEDTWIAPKGTSGTRAKIIGTDGAIAYDSTLGLFGSAERDGEWTFTRMPPDTADTLDVLAAAINNEAEPTSGVRTARNTLSLCLDFYTTTTRRR